MSCVKSLRWKIMASSGWLQLRLGGYFLWMTNNRLIFRLSHLHQEVSCARSANDAHLSLRTALTEIVMEPSLIQITINLYQIFTTKESRQQSRHQHQIVPSAPCTCRELVKGWICLETQTCYFLPFTNPDFGFNGSHHPWNSSPYNRHCLYLSKCFSIFLILQFGGFNSYKSNSTWLSAWKWWQSLSQLSVENHGEIQWECRILIRSSLSTCCSFY